MSASLFHLQALDFAYPDQPLLLKQLSLTIAPADKILLTGANGSGKSTLLDLLAGMLKPRSGNLLLRGNAPSAQAPEAFRELVFRRQKAADDLFGLVPRHDLEAWRLAWPECFSEDAVQNLGDPLLDMLDTPYSRLSAGELRAFTLLWLPLLQDKFWLLDEPTAGLDASRQQRFVELCASKLDSGYLIVSHSTALPARLFTRVLSLENGALKELG
ncbi:MAG TPA: ATP-binding cassette domain-containing protein [Candidatus Syntrophosphaera sp.]|nr:ATP-binding cassette domain-containing protein [Candidatus Syntrophosphaera sp.]HPH61661.1 ATP-binding cassette domain-containing protein [Candidatus Syntrophosphaera sp.]